MQLTVRELKELPRFSWTLSSSGTKVVKVSESVSFVVGHSRSTQTTLLRLHKADNRKEFVLWMDVSDEPDDRVLDLSQIEISDKWSPVSYEAIFRRSGDLNASTYNASNYDEAYSYIAANDQNKEWRDDSFVFCRDDRPSWWD